MPLASVKLLDPLMEYNMEYNVYNVMGLLLARAIFSIHWMNGPGYIITPPNNSENNWQIGYTWARTALPKISLSCIPCILWHFVSKNFSIATPWHLAPLGPLNTSHYGTLWPWGPLAPLPLAPCAIFTLLYGNAAVWWKGRPVQH